jgi:hypothetical protein
MNTMQDALLRANVITTEDLKRVEAQEEADRQLGNAIESAMLKLKHDLKRMIDRDVSDEIVAYLITLAIEKKEVFAKIMCEFSYRAVREPEQVPVYLKEIGCAANSWSAALS